MNEDLAGLEREGIALRPVRPTDLEAVQNLLEQLSLTTAGLEEWWPEFTVAESEGVLVGLAGIERYADGVLLRSVAVHPEWRDQGLGRTLVSELLARAGAAGHRDAYLLTINAEGYFPRFGFNVIARADVPASVQQSVEFRGACPSSAVVMHCRLSGDTVVLPTSAGNHPA